MNKKVQQIPFSICLITTVLYSSLSYAAVNLTGDYQVIGDELTLGLSGSASMTLNGGDYYLNSKAVIAQNAGSIGNIYVSDVGTSWEVTRLELGRDGSANMNILNGGAVNGYMANIHGVASVIGDGSNWNVSHQLTIGNGSLIISDGSVVNSANSMVGAATGTMGDAQIIGIGSVWNAGNLSIASSGSGGLYVQNGGLLTSANADFGTLGNGLLDINGNNSRWDNIGNISLGGYAGQGYLNISDGAAVNSRNTTIGAESYGRVSLSGASAALNNSSYLFVGYSGAGEITIENGASAHSNSIYIGRNNTGFGTATVSGTNSVLRAYDSLALGGLTFYNSGGTGSLTISDGASVEVANTIKIWGGNSISLSDGSLSAGNISNEGVVDISGVAVVDGIVSNEGTGAIHVERGAHVEFYKDFSHNGHVVSIGEGASAIFYGHVSGNSSYAGMGDIYFEGGLDAGGASAVSFEGDVFFGLDNTVNMMVGSSQDIFNVDGTLSLGGVLDVGVDSWFAANEGDTFDLFTAQTIQGGFESLLFADLDPGLNWALSYLYDIDEFGTDVVRLQVVSAVPVPATAWLFGSGLLGLIGVARRKTAA